MTDDTAIAYQAGSVTDADLVVGLLRAEGVRAFQPMSNLDFVSLPLGRYIQNHLDFGRKLAKRPAVFAVNYFLKGRDGEYLNGKLDKRVWVKWMELRVHGEVQAIATPMGHIPLYDDLRRLFDEVLERDYAREAYDEQFTLRIPENLKKLDRISETYRTQVSDTPQELFDVLDAQRERLLAAQKQHGDYVSPFAFAEA